MRMNAAALALLIAPFNQLGWFGLMALLGMYAGIFLFFRGFRLLQHKRLILDTPFSKIRSASIGLVEVSGMPTGPQTIPAGITGEPCYYYRATAWRQSESGKEPRWEKVAEETSCVPFFVDDGTGRVLVFPQGAEMDIHRNLRQEYGESLLSNRDTVPENARNFLLRNGIGVSEAVRLEQYCILPLYPVFVFGTLGENRNYGPWEAEPHVAAESNAANTIFNLPQSPKIYASKMVSYVSVVAVPKSEVQAPLDASTGRLSGPRIESPTRMPMAVPAPSFSQVRRQRFTGSGSVAASIGIASTPVSAAKGDSAAPGLPAGGPRGTGVAIASREELPEFDLCPHTAISKGERNEFFAISSYSQREVADFLGWKAIACIWGGPIIALTFLFLLIIDLTRL